MPWNISTAIIVTLFTLPLIHGSLFNPEIVSKTTFYANTSLDFLFAEADSKYIYFYASEDFFINVLYIMSYTDNGKVTTVGKWQIGAGMLSSLVNPRDGVVVVSYVTLNQTTRILMIDMEANVTITHELDVGIRLVHIRPPSDIRAFYGIVDSNKDATDIYLFNWNDGKVNLEPVPYPLPEHEYAFMGRHIYTETNGVVCRHPFLVVEPPICLNLTDSTQDGATVSGHHFSRDGKRLFMFQTSGLLEHVLMLDVDMNGILSIFAAIPVINSHEISYADFIPSFHGDFVLVRNMRLIDVSNGETFTMYFFGLTYYSVHVALSPRDKFCFFIVSDLGSDSPFSVITYDIHPELAPAFVASTANLEFFFEEGKIVIDQEMGLAFYPDGSPPFIYAMWIDTHISFPVESDVDASPGILFKEPDCVWFSKVDMFAGLYYYTTNWTVQFFLYNNTNSSFYNTITIYSCFPYGIPVGHKLFVGQSGEIYITMLWATRESNVDDYSPVSLSVYYFPANQSFPVYTRSPTALLKLPFSIMPSVFDSEFEPIANLNAAIWNTEGNMEKIDSTGGLNFSTVLTISGAYVLSWVDFTFELESNSITLVQNNTVSTDCRLLQSMHIKGSVWVLCESQDLEYQVRMYTSNKLQPDVQIMSHTSSNIFYNRQFSWWLSADQQRMAFVNTSGTYMFDVPLKTLKYTMNSGFLYLSGGIYKTKNKEQPWEAGSYILVIGNSDGVSLFHDCSPGSKPNLSNYCTKCVPGFCGYGCDPCPLGYVCNGFGLTMPSMVCPAGYYCKEGTSTTTGENGPKPCLAGSYCPGGTGTAVVGTDNTSPKLCEARFYCPEASTLPTQKACPASTFSDYGAQSLQDCKCEKGYFGYEGNCIKCPEKCLCYEDVISRCWVPIPFTNETIPLLCPINSLLGTTACNPNETSWHGETSFPCEKGYSDRQCSKCSEGYFITGRSCHKCTELVKQLLPGAYMVVIVVLLIYAWNIRPTNSATIKIVIVHFQSLLVFIIGGMEWDSLTSRFIHSSTSSFNFSLSSIECLVPNWGLLDYMIVAVTMPFGIGLLALATGMVVWTWRTTKLHFQRRLGSFAAPNIGFTKINLKVLKTIATLADLLYFSVALMTFQMLGCTSASGDLYLSSYPWLRCGTKTWRPYLGIALGSLVFEVIAPPILLLVALRRNKQFLLSKNTKTILGSFYLVYTHDNYFWEGVVISRRLVIACLSTVVPFGNIILFIALFVVFHVYIIALLRRSPYLHRRDNIMDVASQCILLTTLYCGFFVDFAVPNYQNHQISYFAGIANLSFLLCGALCILFDNVPPMLHKMVKLFPRTRAAVKTKAVPQDEWDTELLLLNDRESE